MKVKLFVNLLILCFGLVACSENKSIKTIVFNPTYYQMPINCTQGFVVEGEPWRIQQLLFFVSHIEYKNTKGDWKPLAMMNSQYQHQDVALVGEKCGVDSEQSINHWRITLDDTLAQDDVDTIRFTLGVPFSLNHLNPLTQPSPLNLPSMFWVWQTGHKFLRLELESNNYSWLFHLGSRGCKSASVMRSPSEACSYPNRVTVELPWDKNANGINIDFAKLLNKVNINTAEACQSDHNEPDCLQVLNNLGLMTPSSIFNVSKYDEE